MTIQTHNFTDVFYACKIAQTVNSLSSGAGCKLRSSLHCLLTQTQHLWITPQSGFSVGLKPVTVGKTTLLPTAE